MFPLAEIAEAEVVDEDEAEADEVAEARAFLKQRQRTDLPERLLR